MFSFSFRILNVNRVLLVKLKTESRCVSVRRNMCTSVIVPSLGLLRHRENREFGCPFFQTAKTPGIYPEILKTWVFTREFTFNTGKNLKFWKVKDVKGCDVMFLWSLTFVVNFDLVNWEMEWGYCQYNVEGTTSDISLCDGSWINVI